MVEVKVGDTFSNYYEDRLLSTRTVVKVSDKSIWMQNASGHVFRVKNTGADGYWMPVHKGFKTKNYFYFNQN